jgi:hypothetical protein
MTQRIPKSLVTESGINLEEFPAIVAAYASELCLWIISMCLVVVEESMADVEVFTRPYLPPNVPAVVIIALDWATGLPDFELIDDGPHSEGDLCA